MELLIGAAFGIVMFFVGYVVGVKVTTKKVNEELKKTIIQLFASMGDGVENDSKEV